VDDIDGRIGAFGDNSGGRGFQNSQTGGMFGGTVGYNWQEDNFVYGVEGDWSWVGSKITTNHNIGTGGLGVNITNDVSWLATVRGRVGIVAAQNNLIYLTGGLAFAHVKNGMGAGYTTICDCDSANSDTRVGWTAGAGYERKLKQLVGQNRSHVRRSW
jgi:outer membrane immunogenic protein